MAVEVMVPRLGWSMESGVFAQWLKRDGERVAAGDPIFSIEGEKATEEVESEDEGVLHIRRGVAEPGAELRVGTVIGWLLAEGEPVPEARDAPLPAEAPAVSAAVAEVPAATATTRVAPAHERPAGRRSAASSPRARRVAQELGVDWRRASGTGARGRIRECDVRALAERVASAGGGPLAAPALLPDLSAWGPVELVPMTAAARTMAERRSTVCQTVPMVTQQGTADTTDLEPLLRRYAPRAEAAGGTLSVTAVLVKVATSALKVFPQFNTSLDLAAGRLVRRGYYHIAVAVDTEHGLSYPVVRDVDRKNLLQLAVEIDDLSARAREGTLEPAEIQGGCFSVCDLGGIGSPGDGHFTPLVNPPEAAILGASHAERSPVFDDEAGGFVPRLRMPLSLTYDQRVIDAAGGLRFLRWIVEALQEPLLLALEG